MLKVTNFEDANYRFCKLNFKDNHLYSEDAEMKPAQNGNMPIFKMLTADFANWILKSHLYSEDAEMKPAQNVKSDNF